MERLTKRWGAQPYPNLAGKVICEYKECNSTRSCEECIHGRYKDRLAAIEDILGDEYDLNLVQRLIQAYKEGRYIIMKEPEQAGVSRLRELETIMAYNSDTCQFCKNGQCYVRGGTKSCLPKWRGQKEE